MRFSISLLIVAITSAPLIAASDTSICNRVKQVLLSPQRLSFSVPFTEPVDDQFLYQLDANRDGKPDELEALCGHGGDATCELTMRIDGADAYRFSLPVGIRVISVDGRLFIVNGISFRSDRRVIVKDYRVHELFPNRVTQICAKKSVVSQFGSFQKRQG